MLVSRWGALVVLDALRFEGLIARLTLVVARVWLSAVDYCVIRAALWAGCALTIHNGCWHGLRLWLWCRCKLYILIGSYAETMAAVMAAPTLLWLAPPSMSADHYAVWATTPRTFRTDQPA